MGLNMNSFNCLKCGKTLFPIENCTKRKCYCGYVRDAYDFEEKNCLEIRLIADYEQEYGYYDDWSDEIQMEFDQEWDKIQQRFPKK